jgi:hypothetical protein
MKNIYSLIVALLFSTSIFAQGVATNKFKPAKKKKVGTETIYSNLTPVISLRQSVDCSTINPAPLYCQDFEQPTAPALPADMNTVSEEDNYFVPAPGAQQVVPGEGIQVYGFFTGNSTTANLGNYFPTPEHTQFAMTNDDICLPANSTPNENINCDLQKEQLILPAIDFTGQANTWMIFDYYEDGNFGGGSSSIDVSLDEGSTWTEVAAPGSLPKEEYWQTATINLSAFEDEESVTIRINWSDSTSWATGFAIDDIVINPLPDYAINMIKAEQAFPSTYFGRTTYNSVPLDQASATAFNFIAALKNLGNLTLDSARLNASIADQGFSATSDGKNTVSLAQDTFFCNDYFIPTSLGTYTAEIYGSSDNNVTTTTETVTFNVTQFDYARDNAGETSFYDGRYPVNYDGDQQYGNIYDIYADQNLYSIKVRLHPTTSPNAMAKAVLNLIDISTGEIIFVQETGLRNVGAYTDGWFDFVFSNPIPLSAGEVVLPTIYAEFNEEDTVYIAMNGNSAQGESLVQDINGVDGTAGDWYFTESTPMVRLNFDPNAVGINENEFENGNFKVYPNPNNGTFNLNINISESSDLSIDIQNVLGQTVYSETLNNVSNLVKQINLSKLEKGIYTINILDKNGISSSEKIIIQ